MFYWNKRTREGLQKALRLFQDAVSLDPAFAVGWAGIAQAYAVMASNNYEDPTVCFPKAKEYAMKALFIDDRLAEAHTVLGTVSAGYDRDFGRAEDEFRQAIDLNPSYPTAHQWYSQLLESENRKEEAWAEIKRALELSPLSLIINANMADAHYWQGRYEEGIEQAKRVIEMDPSFPVGYFSLILNLLMTGRLAEADSAFETFSKVAAPEEAKVLKAYILAYEGRKEEARRLLAELEGQKMEGGLSRYFVATIWVKIGEVDRGFEWIQKAYDAHDRYVMLMGIDRDLEGVRVDPRYQSMLVKIGLAAHLRP
jgi:serine/threonine-protein kinase